MNYISRYDYNVTNEKEKDKNIDAEDKWKVNDSVPILKLFKAIYHV